MLIFGDFSTPVSVIDRTSRQKSSTDMEKSNNTISQLGLCEINISSTQNRIHILFKYTWNIHQNEPYKPNHLSTFVSNK